MTCKRCKYWNPYNYSSPEKEGRCSYYPRSTVTPEGYECSKFTQKAIPTQVTAPKAKKKLEEKK